MKRLFAQLVDDEFRQRTQPSPLRHTRRHTQGIEWRRGDRPDADGGDRATQGLEELVEQAVVLGGRQKRGDGRSAGEGDCVDLVVEDPGQQIDQRLLIGRTDMPGRKVMGDVLMWPLYLSHLIFALGWLLRRVGPMAGQGGQHIRLLSSLPLGPRDRLLLVDVGGTQMLLGAAPGRINTLHVFEQPVADLSQAAAGNSDFARKLQAILKRDQTP